MILMRPISISGLLAGVLFAAPASKDPLPGPAAKPAKAQPAKPAARALTDGQVDFCNVIIHCGLPMPWGYCPDLSLVPKPKFTYDSARCFEARLLHARGLTPAHPAIGYKLYRFLGMEYRVIYDIEEELPITEARLAYLLADLPLSARIISHYRKEPYKAEYLDAERSHFKGEKGKRVRGEARMVSGSSQERRLFYFGVGVATVAFWTLKGPALLDFQYWAKDRGKLRYHMKILVFPGNGIINGIMNMGLFRKVVYSKIKEVLDDITFSAHKLAETGAKDILQSKDWTAEEKKKIEAFLKLP